MTASRHSFQRLRWHSRRGMLELDLVFVPFTDHHFENLAPALQDEYVRLLDCEDQDLLAWWLAHEQPADPGLARIIEVIRTTLSGASLGSAALPPD